MITSEKSTSRQNQSLPLLPHHLADLRRAGLSDNTIQSLGFHSGTATEVKEILGFDAGPGLVIPYPCVGGLNPFSRVKPDREPDRECVVAG